MDYKKMYFHLFNVLTDAIEEITHGDVLTARDMLIKAQQETEEMHMEDNFVFNTAEDEARWHELGNTMSTMPIETGEDVDKLKEILDEMHKLKPFPPFGVLESWERFKEEFDRLFSASKDKNILIKALQKTEQTRTDE